MAQQLSINGVGGGGGIFAPPIRRDESEGGYIGRSASTSPHHIPTTSTSSLVASPPKAGASPLLLFSSTKPGPVDEAMEREIELEALRKENEELRRLLGIGGDYDQVGVIEEVDEYKR